MPVAYSLVRLPSGETVHLCPGDWIGRHVSAALRLDDGRVSEAHALVSLRGGALCLMALRGQLSLDGLQASEIRLAPGQRISLAAGVVLEVEEIWLPDRALALVRSGAEPVVLSAPLYSLGVDGRLTAAWMEDAVVHLWSDGHGYRWSPRAGDARDLVEGAELAAGLRVMEVPLRLAETPLTHALRLHPPLRIVARHETTHLHREGWPPLALDGQQGRLTSDLAVMGVPAPWVTLAEILWPDEPDMDLNRRRFDRLIAKLRARLHEAGIRPNLVRADGKGNFELFLLPADTVVDET